MTQPICENSGILKDSLRKASFCCLRFGCGSLPPPYHGCVCNSPPPRIRKIGSRKCLVGGGRVTSAPSWGGASTWCTRETLVNSRWGRNRSTAAKRLWFLAQTVLVPSMILVSFACTIMVLPSWFCHYGSTIMVLPLWFYHDGSTIMALPLWLYHYGSTIMVLPLWFYYYGSTIMVLPLWFCHYGSATMVLPLW